MNEAAAERPSVTVLVPSYRRPEMLLRCLDGVLAGSVAPDQIVVVLRDADEDSRRALTDWRAYPDRPDIVEVAEVTEAGPMAAANAGLKLARGDVVALLDDDCVPTERWLEHLLVPYADPEVIGVGGRDIVHHGEVISAQPQPVVGRVTWYGRIIGNHHQPGFDRPVGKLNDFIRFMGHRAKIRLTTAVKGRQNFTGVLAGVIDEMVQLQVDNETVSLNYKDITRARLINYNGER